MNLRDLVLIVGLALLICSLAIACHFFKPFIDLETCLSQPERFDGSCIEIYNNTKAGKIISPNEIELIKGKLHIRVIGPIPENLKINNFISLKAIFHKEGYLELVQLRIAKGRRIKIIVSIFPVIFVFLLFFKHFKFNMKRFQFEMK